MIEDAAGQSKQTSEHDSGCQCGCGSKLQTLVATDEKTASEQTPSDEVVRARNKRVRTPSSAPGPASVPPFSNHSGRL
jgi:hypothetical protein